MKPIALQLYTLRAMAAQDYRGMLRKVAEIGYKGVETAGLQGCDPKEIADLVKELGMEVCSMHTEMPNEDNVRQLAETAQILGSKKIVSGFGPDAFSDLEACKKVVSTVQHAAELLKPYGIEFGYHNHWWEFQKVDDTRIFDLLMAEAPDVFSELDVYWVAWAKDDPAKVISQYGARMPLLHIKDGTMKSASPMTAVGSGVLDIPSIVHAANPDVLQWLIVELDEYDGDMVEAVTNSYKYLTSQELAAGNK